MPFGQVCRPFAVDAGLRGLTVASGVELQTFAACGLVHADDMAGDGRIFVAGGVIAAIETDVFAAYILVVAVDFVVFI